jgi:hypothetical protein
MALAQRHSPSNLTRLAPAPAHLEKPERDLWTSLTRSFKFDDEGSLELLASALEARMRSRRCRIAIDQDGEVWRDARAIFGRIRSWPPSVPPAHRSSGACAFCASIRQARNDYSRSPIPREAAGVLVYGRDEMATRRGAKDCWRDRRS